MCHPNVGVVIMLVAAVTRAAGQAEEEAAPCRVIDLLPDFQAYRAAGQDANSAARRVQWEVLLEAKHAVFFRDAIYRRLEGEARETHKQHCIETFWKEVAPRLDAIVERSSGTQKLASEVAREFRHHFPDFKGGTDLYFTISFSFRGKQLEVGDRQVIGIGLEMFTEPGDIQLRLTLAHELFHLHHLATFPGGRGLYRALWQEGMASYVSTVVVPGTRMSAALGFTPQKMNLCEKFLPKMAAELRDNLGSTDHALRRAYFGAEANDLGIPPEAGYYVGLLIVQRLARDHELSHLARLAPDAVFPLLRTELQKLAGKGS